MSYELRNFMPGDTAAMNRIALAAFAEYQSAYSDWPTFSKNIGNMAALAEHGEIIVAAEQGQPIGGVAYIGPGRSKGALFKAEWPIIRMLVVEPASRCLGVGRALTEECIARAERDGARCIALHTTPIMKVALPMYKRMGFEFHSDAPAIFGVPYAVYLKKLSA